MAEEPEIDFGTFLRQARERRGMSLQHVAATTKISARVLGALEHNDASKLPGGIFARAFVRAYAREVGLDPEATVTRFVAEFPDTAAGEERPAVTSGEDPEAFESGRRAVLTVLQLAGISVLIIIAILIYVSTQPADVQSASPPPSEQRPASSPDSSAAPGPGGREASLPGVLGAGLTDGTSPGERGAAAPGATPGAPRVTIPAPADAAAPLSVVILATQPCWLSLTVDGKEVVSRLLDTGERLAYDGQASMVLKAGNAGALQLTLNGRRGRSLGGSGQVVTRTITPATLASFIEQ